MKLQVGDWTGTQGHAKFPAPLSVVYWGIGRYQRGRYPVTVWNPKPIWDVDHAFVVTGQRQVFEQTFPVARFQTFAEAGLAEKFAAGDLFVARFCNAKIDPARLLQRARYWNGKPYDLTDLPNFALSGLLGIFNRMIVWLGPDKVNQFRTCSPVAADILQFAGVPFPMDTKGVDPAAPFNAFGQPTDESALWWPTNITSQLTKESFT